jgi:hypothetical protein
MGGDTAGSVAIGGEITGIGKVAGGATIGTPAEVGTGT